MNKEKIAVVIPFYQKESGILLRAINSVFQQKGLDNFNIFVVDDGSPIKARDELSSILIDFSDKITVLEQENSGPAKARNVAIQAARKGAFNFIAFLDSDDEWELSHIDTAIKCLGPDKDFYFSDVVHLDGARSVFETKNFPARDFKNCISLKNSDGFEYVGDLFTLILAGYCPIATPAVVYRLSSFDFLFREDLTTAGEDYFFWLQVASHHQRIVFSTYKGVKLNYGVNLYASVKWGTSDSIKQILHNWRYNYQLNQYFTLSSEQIKFQQANLHKLRKQFVENLVHILLHRKHINWGLVREYISSNPEVLFLVPFKIIKTGIVKLLTRLSI